MEVERWDPDRHLPLLRSWLVARGQASDTGPSDLYPDTGLVVGGAAVAFLYCTNAPGVAYLDGLVTDPAAPPRRRREAVELLCRRLVEMADERGVRVTWCMTGVGGLEPILLGSGFELRGVGFGCFSRSTLKCRL